MVDYVSLAFFMDGDMWCCVGEGFSNLEESVAGFGKTRGEALDDYCENLEK